MDSRQRIVKASRRLRTACTLLIWALPLAAAFYWLGLNWLPPAMNEPLRQQLPIYVSQQLPLYVLILGWVGTMGSLGVVVYGLVQLRRLFGLYGQGLIFDARNVWCLRNVGKAMVVWALTETVSNALVGIVITLPNPPGQRILTLGFSSGQVLALFGGLMVMTIAWVMEEGRKIQAEQSLIV